MSSKKILEKSRSVSYLIWKDKDLDELEGQFHSATCQGNSFLAAACIKRGVDPNIEDDDGLTALHHAAIRSDIPMGNMLLRSKKTDINQRTEVGDNTALMLACTYGNVEFVRLLLKRGAKPNIMNNKRQRALHIAAIQNNFKVTIELINKGAKINVTDVFDCTPLSIAVIDRCSKTMTKLLLSKGANATVTKEFPLLLECVLNCNTIERLEILEVLMKYDVDVYCLHPISRRNCLHYVGLTGYLPAAEFLLPLGESNLRVKDLCGKTPVDVAFDHQNWDVYKFFRRRLEHKALVVSFADDIIVHLHKLFDDE